MRNIKKSINVLAIAILLVSSISSYAGAAVSEINASAGTSSVTVSGSFSSDAAAVMIEVVDVSTNEVLKMYSMAVDLQNNFSGTIDGLSLTAGNEYIIRAADYSGGTWSSTTVSANAPAPAPQQAPASTPTVTEEPKKEEVKEEVKEVPKANAPSTKPETKEVTVSNKPSESEKIVSEEAIETAVPEGVSEEAVEELKEQVSSVVSELIEKIESGDSEIASAVSEETMENIKNALAEGKEIVAEVSVKVVSVDSLPAEDKASIEAVLSEQKDTGIEVACFLDLGVMLKTDDGQELGNYNELTGEVTFTIEAPKDVPCPEGKEYVVIRTHNGEAAILPVTINPDGTLSFSTDKLSSYALAVRDIVDEPVPAIKEASLDNAIVSTSEEASKKSLGNWVFWVAGLILLAGVVTIVIRMKNEAKE